MKKIITVLLSVLLIAGLFTGCNGDAASALVNNSVDTTITMSLGNVEKEFMDELKTAVNEGTISLYWYVFGTKPGSDENDKLVEVLEKFSFDNPTFSREVSFEADNPAVFGLAIDELDPDAETLSEGALGKFNDWMKERGVGKELPVSWKITGHKINESGTENLKVEEIKEEYLIKYMKLNEETLRMTKTPTGVEETKTLTSYMVQPVAVKIGHSSVSKYSEGSRSADGGHQEVVYAPEDRFLDGGKSLYEKLIEGEDPAIGSSIDRFSTQFMEDIFIYQGEDSGVLFEKAKAGKLIVVPGEHLKDFIDVFTNGEGAAYSYIPYGYEVGDLDTSKFYLYFGMREKEHKDDVWDTYFSYSDFSMWSEEEAAVAKESMIVDFQDEIDSFASFMIGEHATPSGSRDITKALEDELSSIKIRYKIYHLDKTERDPQPIGLFITSKNRVFRELASRYEWSWILYGKGSNDTHPKVRDLDFGQGYGERVSSSREITLWVIHDVKKGEHLYVIKDQPYFDFSSVFISNAEGGKVLPLKQHICNNRPYWNFYGIGASPLCRAMGMEWYGDGAWIETRVFFTDGVSRNNGYAFGNMAPATTTRVMRKTDSVNFGVKGGLGWEIKGTETSFKINVEGSYGVTHTTSEDVEEVSVFNECKTGADDPVARWRYLIRDDFNCGFGLGYGFNNFKHGPSNTSISTLKPPTSLYTISVADAYVNKVGLKLNSEHRLKRKAFKFGKECCVGFTWAVSEASCVLPYDKDPSHYADGKFPW